MEDRTLSYDEFNAPEQPLIPPDKQWMAAPVIFGVLTLGMFIDVLFTGSKVVSHTTTDLALQFLTWRDFGFSEMAKGNLPLWNPHIYGGAPYLAGFQSALLYPPNWLHLIMSVPVAINWIIALHVFMLGYFVYFLCRGYGVGIGGSILAGVMYMFCGPYFLHLYAGHLPHLAVIVWIPLLFLSLHKLGQTGEWKWLLLGIVATSMHILSGHPQYVYYTGMTVAAYTVLSLLAAQYRSRLMIGFVGMYFGAVLVTAVQLFSGIDAATEGVRSTGLKYETAATFALAPGNLLTLLAPNFFSHLPMTQTGAGELPYWGPGYLWEMSFFLSITGLVLAILGVVRAFESAPSPAAPLSTWGRIRHELHTRQNVLIPAALIFITFILALGRHTPLYQLMYDHLPGYNGFRGTVKFACIAALFISLLAAMGFDSLVRNRKVNWVLVGIVGVGALLMFLFAGVVSSSSSAGTTGWWGKYIASTIDAALKAEELFNGTLSTAKTNATFLTSAAEQAAFSLVLAGLTLVIVAVVLGAARFNSLIPYILILLVAVEMFTFARSTRATMDPSVAALPKAKVDIINEYKKLRDNPRYLTIAMENANAGMSSAVPFDNLNGYDPGVLRYYAEVIAASQGVDTKLASQYLPFRTIDDMSAKLFRALRCAVIFPPNPQEPHLPLRDPLPLVSLYGTWARMASDGDLLTLMFSPTWEPRSLVLLSSGSNVPMAPTVRSVGSVKVIDQGTDHLEIQADATQAAMMLVTNNYSEGWRVVKIDSTSDQREYLVVRANYTQMGIPLRAGRHHLRLEYSPLAYRLGWWVSFFALLGLVGWAILLMRRPAWFR